jgi:hypothetical protein
MRVGGAKEGGTHGHKWMQIAFVTIALTITGPVPGIAQSSQPKSDTYT